MTFITHFAARWGRKFQGIECIIQTENSEDIRCKDQLTKGQTCYLHANLGSCFKDKGETRCLIFADWYL